MVSEWGCRQRGAGWLERGVGGERLAAETWGERTYVHRGKIRGGGVGWHGRCVAASRGDGVTMAASSEAGPERSVQDVTGCCSTAACHCRAGSVLSLRQALAYTSHCQVALQGGALSVVKYQNIQGDPAQQGSEIVDCSQWEDTYSAIIQLWGMTTIAKMIIDAPSLAASCRQPAPCWHGGFVPFGLAPLQTSAGRATTTLHWFPRTPLRSTAVHCTARGGSAHAICSRGPRGGDYFHLCGLLVRGCARCELRAGGRWMVGSHRCQQREVEWPHVWKHSKVTDDSDHLTGYPAQAAQ